MNKGGTMTDKEKQDYLYIIEQVKGKGKDMVFFKNGVAIMSEQLYEEEQAIKDKFISKVNDIIEFCNRYLSLNLDAFDTRDMLNKIVEILERDEQ